MDYRKSLEEETAKQIERDFVHEAAPILSLPDPEERERQLALFRKLLTEGPDPDRVYTMEDIEALPEGIWGELIDGKMYVRGTPKVIHQVICGEMFLTVTNHIRSKGGKCRTFIPPFGVFIRNDESTYLVPDLTVVCDGDKIDEYGCVGAPDWVVEVISPSTRRLDYGKKLFLYRETGVREYWIIEPVRRTVMVYVFEDGKENAELYSFEDEIPCTVFPDLKIRLADVV